MLPQSLIPSGRISKKPAVLTWNILTIFLVVFLVACQGAQPASLPAPGRVSGAPQVEGAPEMIRIGVVLFLSGSAAAPFGLPAKNGAEIMVSEINLGQAPEPYQTPGISGVPIQLIFVDEAGGVEKQVAELKRLYLEEKVDLVIGYISSGDCLAAAPVAEEMQRLAVFFDCGTSRLFEEASYHYVFRTNAHQAIDSLAGARYLLSQDQGIVRVAGINQNYAWGQDSWAHFRDTLLALNPDIQIVSDQFPKLGAGDYKVELDALAQAAPQAIHTSFWGADLENLVDQAQHSSLSKDSKFLFSVGEYALPILGRRIAPGTIIGAHGPHGIMAPPGSLNTWLVKIYQERYKQRPTYPVYHMSQALLGVKMAYEKAIAEHQRWPTVEQVIQSFEYLQFPTPSGPISLAIGEGHQAVEPAVYATAGSFNPGTGEVNIEKVMIYPVECVNPPQGITTEEWILDGFPGSQCP